MATSRRGFWRVVSVSRMQIPTRVLLLAVVVLAVLLAAALVVEGRSSAVRDLPPATLSIPPQALANGQYRFVPHSAHVTPGVHYRFPLYTHCGLDYPVAVDFDGSYWDPTGKASGGNGNPPPGYGNAIDNGIMTLISPTSARYQSQNGMVMNFTRHPGSRVSGLCF
ncbi:MAG: hypothetical protein M3Z11_04270 [Candidatus Dormibacteraeota bacterium]|nr:hypothetical protein [Candidatus Dormibacteraeota bacterium]